MRTFFFHKTNIASSNFNAFKQELDILQRQYLREASVEPSDQALAALKFFFFSEFEDVVEKMLLALEVGLREISCYGEIFVASSVNEACEATSAFLKKVVASRYESFCKDHALGKNDALAVAFWNASECYQNPGNILEKILEDEKIFELLVNWSLISKSSSVIMRNRSIAKASEQNGYQFLKNSGRRHSLVTELPENEKLAETKVPNRRPSI